MTQAIIKKWWKENRCFLSIHKAFNFSMYSDLSLSLSPFSLYISKFPFYIQRHYRKAFNSSHNVLCIWILKEEMETFFAAAFKKLFQALKKERRRRKVFFCCLFENIPLFVFYTHICKADLHWNPFYKSTKL